MRHYVLTRSAYGPAWDLAANRRRLEITRAVTARLMAAQTEQDWTWVVLLDERDPLLRDRLDLYGSSAPAFIPIVQQREQIEPSRAAAADYGVSWRGYLGPLDDKLLTTRLDDDDGFAPNAIARYQDGAAYVPSRTALMLPVGLHVWRGRCAVVRHGRNAMHTLVTPAGDTMTVYDYGHTKVAETVPVLMLGDEPGWIWIRHRDTISLARNAARWAGKPAPASVRALFPIDWSAV